MFTGIVKGAYPIAQMIDKPGMKTFSVFLPKDIMKDLEIGCSISVDGVCLTVTEFDDKTVRFDAIQETLIKTTMNSLEKGRFVNIERAAKYGDEIGGHLLSGHIFGTAHINHIELFENNTIFTIQVDPSWIKYLFPKGYVALDGVSLTIVDVNSSGTFTVHLIPQTLKLTTFTNKKSGDLINVEIDAHTQAIVESVERSLQQLTCS